MKIFKLKFSALLLVIAFVASIFSGICIQPMDMDEGMAMAHSGMEMEHEHGMEHPNVDCKQACEVSTYESSRVEIVDLQDTPTKFSLLAYEARDVIVENIFVSQWDPPIWVAIAPAGSYQERVKLLI